MDKRNEIELLQAQLVHERALVQDLEAGKSRMILDAIEIGGQFSDLREAVRALKEVLQLIMLKAPGYDWNTDPLSITLMVGNALTKSDHVLAGEPDEENDSLQAQLTQRTAELEAATRERDEAIREHGKESGFWGRSCARLLDKRDKLQAALDAEREKVKGLEAQMGERFKYHELFKKWQAWRDPDELVAEYEKYEAAQTQLSQLQALMRALLTVLDEIDRYQQQPERSDIDTECACCMGELFSAEDRTKMVEARAILDATTPAATIGEQCSYCQKPLTTNHSFSYGFPGVPRVYKCDRTECIKPKGGDGES